MQTKTFIRLPKSITKAGEWKCGALNPKHKMSKGAFPVGTKRSFQLGNQWYWRVDILQCGPFPGRLLTAYHLGKENYIAWLAIERAPGEHTVVGCFEHHFDHDGWHWHSKCCPINELASGCTRQRQTGARIPRKGGFHRVRGYDMGPQEAVNLAYKAFRITGNAEQGSML